MHRKRLLRKVPSCFEGLSWELDAWVIFIYFFIQFFIFQNSDND